MGKLFSRKIPGRKIFQKFSRNIFQKFSRNFASEKVSRNFNLKLLIIKRDKLIHIFIHITYTYNNK